jgi:hemoglobin
MTDDFFTAVGGHDVFERIVRRFYEGVKTDPILRPMYPEDDFEGAVWRLTAFLEQYWGGPTAYSDQRGHPRLRARHQPFRIDDVARDHWLTLMTAAVAAEALSPLHHETLMDYLDRAAHAMVNTMSDIERDDRKTL